MLTARAATTLSRPFGLSARRYATAGPENASGGARTAAYASIALLTGVGAYFYLQTPGSAAPKLSAKVAQEKSPLDPKEFRDFKLKRVETYNHNTKTFVFELPDNQASLLPVASCLVVKASDDDALKDKNGKPVVRPYTPITPSDYPGELALLIKKYDTGAATPYIHSLQVGDTLSIKGPFPKFDYKANQFEQVGLIGGGSGITPLYQIVAHALADKGNKTKFSLLFSNVTEADILLREEWDSLAKKFPETLKVVYTLDKPDDKWNGVKGYVTPELVKQHIGPASLGEKVKIFVCGPPPQVNAIAGKKDGGKQGQVGGVLKELGYTEDQIYKF